MKNKDITRSQEHRTNRPLGQKLSRKEKLREGIEALELERFRGRKGLSSSNR